MGESTLAAPTPNPPRMRATTNTAEEPAAPAASALTMKQAAAAIITLRRPTTSARRAAPNAPAAHPRRMAPTFSPVPNLDRWKVVSSPSCVPLMTPES